MRLTLVQYLFSYLCTSVCYIHASCPVLSDEGKRGHYDRYGHLDEDDMMSEPMDLNDILAELFGGPGGMGGFPGAPFMFFNVDGSDEDDDEDEYADEMSMQDIMMQMMFQQMAAGGGGGGGASCPYCAHSCVRVFLSLLRPFLCL